MYYHSYVLIMPTNFVCLPINTATEKEHFESWSNCLW